MSLPLPILSNMLFRDPNKLRRLESSQAPHERWVTLAAKGEEAQLKHEVFWHMGNPNVQAVYPFARTEVTLDVDHRVTATSTALIAGSLGCLKLLVSAQRLNATALGQVFEQAAFVWQRSQAESPDPLLHLSEDQKTCVAWLMTRGLELRDHLPSLAVHERTSGASRIKRTGDAADPYLENFIIHQAEQTVALYNELRDIQQELAPDSHAPRLTANEGAREAWNLMGHTFLRWRLADQARLWLSKTETLPFFPGTTQPSYIERNFRHYDIVEVLLDRNVPLGDERALELIQHVNNDQKSREAQWQHGFKPRRGVEMTVHQHTRLLEQEIQIQDNVLEVLDLVAKYQQVRPTPWTTPVQRKWELLRHQVANRREDLDDEITLGLRHAVERQVVPAATLSEAIAALPAAPHGAPREDDALAVSRPRRRLS